MNSETFKLLLAVWGAGLSSLLAIIAILNFRKENKIKLNISGMVEKPFTELKVYVFNDGSKAASISGYSIGIGPSAGDQREILKEDLNKEKKLEYPARWTKEIERSRIIESYNKLQSKRYPYERLWLNIFLTSKKRFTRVIYIDPGIITNPYYDRAGCFIAADIFLGLPQMESKVYPYSPHK